MVMRRPELATQPALTGPNEAIERCADYLRRIHFWIQLWSVLSLLGAVLLFFAVNSSAT